MANPYMYAAPVSDVVGGTIGGETGQAVSWGGKGAALGATLAGIPTLGIGAPLGAGIGAGVGALASLFSKAGGSPQQEAMGQLRKLEKAKREQFRQTVEEPTREAYRRSAISALQRQQTGLARRGLGDSPMGVGLAAGMQRQYDVDAESNIARVRAQMEGKIADMEYLQRERARQEEEKINQGLAQLGTRLFSDPGLWDALEGIISPQDLSEVVGADLTSNAIDSFTPPGIGEIGWDEYFDQVGKSNLENPDNIWSPLNP